MRFVQLYHTNWDSHGGPGENLQADFEKVCRDVDQAQAALVKDLKARGLLDETLIIWGGEFGRTPMGENRDTTGRNHHIDAFTMWFAGGGVKAGAIIGQTDELGFNPVEDRCHVHDIHATILHLLGLEHTRLTFRFQGRDLFPATSSAKCWRETISQLQPLIRLGETHGEGTATFCCICNKRLFKPRVLFGLLRTERGRLTFYFICSQTWRRRASSFLRAKRLPCACRWSICGRRDRRRCRSGRHRIGPAKA